ncbi:family 88 glycosyl hydrolase [Flagelloscypha sp. PMI_526]|nr:family 88 glycosyl hydrolase [Flagelloscypha sp. PMI_526]
MPILIPLCIGFSLLATALGGDPYSQAVPFDIKKVVAKAVEFPSHSWEYGTAVEALLEIYNPELSVFGKKPFPAPTVAKEDVLGLKYAASVITIGTGKDSLADGDGAVGDPASLGVSAYLLGKTNQTFMDATLRQLDYVVNGAPRNTSNGAISHRADVVELWSDFIYMAPPFMAYMGAETSNITLLEDALRQITAYHEVMNAPMRNTTPPHNLWLHIVGPQSADLSAWGTGNGWASAGSTRVLATILKAPCAPESFKTKAKTKITAILKEMFDGVLAAKKDGDLYRNYLDDYESPHGFGELAGMSMLSNAVFRMAVLVPEVFGKHSKYVKFAKETLAILGRADKNGKPYVTEEGVVRPTVNPLGWGDTTPFETGSPEAQGFVSLAYAAFRDCVQANKCDSTLEYEGPSAQPQKRFTAHARMERKRAPHPGSIPFSVVM